MMTYTAKIEQTHVYHNRMKYLAKTDSFIEKENISLFFKRNVRQPYGWIKESGTPPSEHLDVILMTDKEYELGDEERVKIIGVFYRNDEDHKLVGVLEYRDINDFSELSDIEKDDMHRLYPREDIGEGWFGRDRAEDVINTFFEKRRKM
jgi:inorganic pyrophosphatase